MKNSRVIIFSMVILIAVAALSFDSTFTSTVPTGIKVLIDAGHGGEDPGKVVGDIKESQINLSIAKALKEELENIGIEVRMTRSEEQGLTENGAAWDKNADMQIRKNMIISSDCDIFISVHQNSHSDTSCRGGQVFFSDSMKENQILADIMQQKLAQCAPFENKRTALINNEYLVLRGNTAPSVIVECGFMTNSEEIKLLLSDEYQRRIAEALAEGVKEFILRGESEQKE